MTPLQEDKQSNLKMSKGPWLVWLSQLTARLQTKGLLVQFLVRAHVWVAGQVPSGGWEEHMRGNHTLMFLSIYFSPLPFSLKIK